MGFLPQRLLYDNDDTRARRLGVRRPGTTFPAGPVIGDLFYEIDTDILWVWKGSAWRVVSGGGTISGTTNFLDGVELYQPSSTPYIDFHAAANAAGDGGADYKSRLIMAGGSTGRMDLVVGNSYTYSWWADGEFDCHHVGVNGDNTSNVGVKITTGSGGMGLYFEDVLSDQKISLYGSGDYCIGVRASAMYFRNNGGRFQFETPNGSWAMLYGPSEVNGGERGLNVLGNLEGGEVYATGWLRGINAATGWYNNFEACGMRGSNLFGSSDSVDTQHNETQVVGRKLSQAGWATAGIESFSEASNAVPYITNHASGCCTASFRKDSGQSYMVCINSGGGCDQVFASAHPICSEEARKHNISIVNDYGLKTLRGLNLKRYQYTPVDESEIWAWESWKHDRARGVWTNPPNEHMGWDTWHVGYFAEEMANLVPEVVGYMSDGTPKGIDYGNLVVVAIEAIKELADKVEDLEARLVKSYA